jgi:hypothetical protein
MGSAITRAENLARFLCPPGIPYQYFLPAGYAVPLYAQYTQVYSARAKHVDSAGQRIWVVVLKASDALVSALGIREIKGLMYWNRMSHYSRADGDGTTSDTCISIGTCTRTR